MKRTRKGYRYTEGRMPPESNDPTKNWQWLLRWLVMKVAR
jgi:hypothetical protein